MKLNEINDNDGQLDGLFQSARNEAPKYAFTEASSVFTSALAIGVATAAHAKVITSSIFKSKIFIMSISTITAITSAVLIYSSADPSTTPNVTVVEEGQSTKKTLLYEAPQEKTPEGVFVADDTLKFERIPEDSIKSIKLDIQDNLLKAQITLKDAQVKLMELNLSTLKNLDIDVDNLTEDLEITLDDLQGLTINLDDFEIGLEEMNLVSELKMEEMENLIENELEILYSMDTQDDGVNLITHFITNRTTIEELDEIKKAATKAGIKFTYSAKVKRDHIKKLNLSMTLIDKQGRTKRECMNLTISGSEMFSHTLQWNENEEGKAVNFGKGSCQIRTSGRTSTAKRVYISNPPNPKNPPNPANPPNPENPPNPPMPEKPESPENN